MKKRKLIIVLCFALCKLTSIHAATWTQTTDSDFNVGTSSNVFVVGTGDDAYIKLSHPGTLSWSSFMDGTPARFGCSVSYAGDVNNDGYDDVIVGEQESKAYLYLGSSTGLSSTPTWTEPGNSVSYAGDINNDGYDDVIVGVPGYDNGIVEDVGKAYLYLGSSSGLSSTPTWTSSGDDRASAYFGCSVSYAGDVNNDGYDDVIVGAYLYNTANSRAGKAYLYLGTSSGLSSTPTWTSSGDDQAWAYFGNSVSYAGDVNNDGYDDVIVGAYAYETANLEAGKAYLYLGTASGLSSTPAWTSSGVDGYGHHFGCSVSYAGDVNNDGYDDVIVGANGYAGRAYLYLGSSSGISSTPAWSPSGDGQIDAEFGGSVSYAGDVNNDGYDDVIVGAAYYDTFANSDVGKAYLYLGSSSGLSLTFAWSSTGDDHVYVYFGRSVSYAGDVNNDGYDEVIVGAPGNNNPPTSVEGKAYLYEFLGIFISKVQDCDAIANWGNIIWTENLPAINLQTRTGNTASPDDSWSSWSSSYTVSGSSITSPSARYIQVKANFSTSVSSQTPTLYDFTITYNCSPSTPSNISPSLDEAFSWHHTNPTFSWSSFSDVNGDTQTALQVQLRYSTGTYGDGSRKDSGEISSSTNTYTPADWNLSPENTYYWKVRVKDNSGFDNAWSTWSAETVFYIKYNVSPSSPTNTLPADGAQLSRTNVNPTFSWSAFYDVDIDSQSALQVQLRYSTGTYGDTGSKASGELALSSATWASTNWNLPTKNTYYWRVKLKDNSGFDNAWSTWSVETSFYISDNLAPDTPENASPANEWIAKANPVFKWSDFYDVDGDSQSALQIQLRYSTGAYSDSCSKDSGEVSDSTNTWTSSNWELVSGASYYWKVRVKDNFILRPAWSLWSNETAFKVDLSSPSAPSSINDGYGSDIDWIPSDSTDTISANWSEAEDNESGIAKYWYAIGTSSNLAAILSWTDGGLVRSISKSGLNLAEGNTYYVSVKAENNAGLMSEVISSDGQLYQPTYPTGKSGTPTDIGTGTDLSSIKFTWTAGTVADAESGISGYWLQVSTSPDESGNYKYNAAVGDVLEYTVTNCEDKKTYYARVKAINGAGMYSAWSEWSDGIEVWLVAPDKPTNVDISLASAETEITDNETLNITGTAEAGTTCEIVVKDQNGKTLTSGITASNLSVGDDGLINAQVSLGKITKNYPIASQIQVEVSLIDPAGNKSSAASSSFVVFKAEKAEVKLYDNLINPADGKPVTIRYELPYASRVTIEIYNRSGFLIKKIVDGQLAAAGIHTAEWFGKNTAGNIVASGIYVIHIKTDSYSKILKAIVVK